MTVVVATVFAAAVGVLAFSIVAKVTDWPETTAMWPVIGRPRRLAGPGQVTTVEVVVTAAVLLPLPVTARLVCLGLLYGLYTGAAVALRGRRCACFGAAAHTTFTVRHAALCGGLAALLLAGATAPAPGPAPVSVVGAGASGLAVVSGLVVWRRHRADRARRALPGRPERATRIVVLGDTGCPVCTALWQQRTELQALACCEVELRYPDTDSERDLAAGRFPAAVGYDAAGAVVAGPVWGPVDIRRLLQATDGDGR